MKRFGLLLVVLSIMSTMDLFPRGGGGGRGGGYHGGGRGGYHGGGRGYHGGYRGGYRGGYYGGGWGWGAGAGLTTGLLVGTAIGSSASSSSSRSDAAPLNNCDRMRNPLKTYTQRFGDPRASEKSWSNYQDWLTNGCQG